ncbi:hypothetical protein GGF46_005346 [Coemansia sp. RSA 552]|nr:hypothetical protein GGF46_005346 [Coemansia sp. RSA 552]
MTTPMGLPPAPKEDVKEMQKRYNIKLKFMEMYEGGIMVCVCTPQQAILAERYGARGIVIMEDTHTKMIPRHGADNYKAMDAAAVKRIMDHVLLPAFVRVRAGHEIEATIMQKHGVTGIFETTDMGKLFSRAFIRKHTYNVPFIADAIGNLADAVMRIDEGAVMLCNHLPTGAMSQAKDISKIFKVIETLFGEIEDIRRMEDLDREAYLEQDILENIIKTGRFPIPFFAQGAITMPDDVAMLRHLGCDGVILTANVFTHKYTDQKLRAAVIACKDWDKPSVIAKLCDGLGGYHKYD